MPWQDVDTVVTGQLVTAAMWNKIVDNFAFQEEVAYTERVSDLTVNQTTAGAAQTVVSAGAVTYEAVPHLITFSAAQIEVGNLGSAFLRFDLWDGSTQLGRFAVLANNAAAVLDVPFERTIRITPTAGSHTFIWKAWQAAADGIVFAGNGAADDHFPAFIRITRAPA